MTLEQLEEYFPKVSQMTLRRDLFQLEEEGKIIRIRGGYHGWSDQFIYNASEAPKDAACLNGIPVECFQSTHCVEPNDIEALEQQFIENEKLGGTAAFVMEAIGQDSGAVPLTREYQAAARERCPADF